MTFTIRRATAKDVPTILQFIRDLAEFEKALDQVEATEATLEAAMFGPGAVTSCLILEKDAVAAGFAIWFYSFSTWQGRKGLYLEDLYVAPAFRGRGGARFVLTQLAKIALEQGCGRFEWSVLDWNTPAIRVYDGVGAEPQSEWIRYRLSGDRLKALAEQ
ncbi:GNAT family N-acetyltransferase [Rhizobium halophytocola]|uniref:RimJ/RimL family protein N-acetyltransferase n=1 Tax=Rhizobium halophytocola TaxID=735519 RepID=A0ABS4DXM7_9HYPH|nr:GNAT family N-acetyltransferase [Rhizobium halophytocola]MBP1850453.1 RimJ/RimL family protein N-acetyltransferase [Rhizobium halophytocola]